MTRRCSRRAARLHRRPAPGRTPAVVILWLTPCLAGCPLPLPRTEALSASVVGVLLRSDATPMPGAEVAVSTDYGDSACARPVARTTTDSAGVFRLPGIQKRYRVTWVIPHLHRVPPPYRLCASVADTLRPAYRGQGSLDPIVPRDSIVCLEWLWDGRTRVTCSGVVHRALASGGRWADGDAGGWYRVILTMEEGRRNDRPRAFLQWVEQHAADRRATVRAMIELPLSTKALSVADPVLTERRGRWCTSVFVFKRTLLGFKQEWLTFALGPPGEARPVLEC